MSPTQHQRQPWSVCVCWWTCLRHDRYPTCLAETQYLVNSGLGQLVKDSTQYIPRVQTCHSELMTTGPVMGKLHWSSWVLFRGPSMSVLLSRMVMCPAGVVGDQAYSFVGVRCWFCRREFNRCGKTPWTKAEADGSWTWTSVSVYMSSMICGSRRCVPFYHYFFARFWNSEVSSELN